MFKAIKNRKAYHNYEIIDKLEAGIALVGTEVKSIRAGQVDLGDAYCHIDDKGNLQLLQLKINPYNFGNLNNHLIDRPRQLLLHKNQIRKLAQSLQNRGLTLVPLEIYFKKQYIKIMLGLAKGRKIYDKKKLQQKRATAHLVSQIE